MSVNLGAKYGRPAVASFGSKPNYVCLGGEGMDRNYIHSIEEWYCQADQSPTFHHWQGWIAAAHRMTGVRPLVDTDYRAPEAVKDRYTPCLVDFGSNGLDPTEEP